MKLTLLSTLTVALVIVSSARAATSTVNEDNGATANGFGNQDVWHQDPSVEHPAILTTGGGAPGAGWDFSSSLASLNVSGIGFIKITLTLVDGNSGPTDTGPTGANFDFNHLFLYVGGTLTGGIYTGGINTGIVLNGFESGQSSTQTLQLSFDPATTGAAILAQLNANGGRLSGFVVSNNTADTTPTGNQMLAGNSNVPSDATTTLELSAVPEPAAWTLLASGLLLVGAVKLGFRKTNLAKAE